MNGLAENPQRGSGFQFDWLTAIQAGWKSRRLIAVIVSSLTVISAVVSLLLPLKFTSRTTLLPEMEQGMSGALSAFSTLAPLVGLSTGTSLAQLYPALILSEVVLRDVIYAEYRTRKLDGAVDLIRYWEIEKDNSLEDYEAALKKIRNLITVEVDARTEIVTIAITTWEPQLSADILQQIVDSLDGFMRSLQTTNATEQRKWIETRLTEIQTELRRTEDVLREFRETNRRIADSPQLMMEQSQLETEVTVNTALYTEMRTQLELIKVEEIKNVPIVKVLDAPRAPIERSAPHRKMIVLVTMVLAFGITSVTVIGYRLYWNDIGQLFRTVTGSHHG